MSHQGANIFLSDITSSVVERAAGELAEQYPNVAVRGLTFDVTDKAQIESAMQTIRDAGNGLQILVNNAGINLREPVADMDDALWQKMLDLCEKHEVEFCWVKGHAGHKYNERCDEMAQSEARKLQ
mgnify:CR=1 FL=1